MADPILSKRTKVNEDEFQKGIRATEWFKEFVREYGEEPDLNTKDYDYRRAWSQGLRPTRNKHDNNKYHWPSSDNSGVMLKSSDHPTAWKELYMRQTGRDPDEDGVTKEQGTKLLQRRPNTPVERWRPFEKYDKFREPGKMWRGDDPEIKKNPKPSTKPGQQSSITPEAIPLEAAVQRVAMEGRYGDTEVAHINPQEQMLLASLGGAGTINPDTGLKEFYDSSFDGGGAGNQDAGFGGDPGAGANNGGGGGNVTTPGEQLADSIARGDQIDFSTPDYNSAFDALGENFGTGNPSRAGKPDQTNTWDSSNNWGLGIGDASALAGYGTGVLGALSYAAGVGGKAAMAGIENSANNLTFGDVAGFLGGAAVSTLTAGLAGPAIAGVAGPLAGAIGGRVAGTVAGNYAGNAITSAINNSTPTSATNPNQSAPTTTTASADPGFADDTRGGASNSLNYDQRIAPLTSAAVTPLAVQPTTTVADDTVTTNPFRSGIYIPPVGAPTAGRPLAIT